MDLNMNITIHTEWNDEEVNYVRNGITEYNKKIGPMLKYPPYEPINLFIKDMNGKVLGGLLSKIYLHSIYIDILWIDENYRRFGYGSRLLTEVEKLAKEKGCKFIHLDTFSFQAIDFYKKLGFEVFGILEDFPDDIKRYFLKKRL